MKFFFYTKHESYWQGLLYLKLLSDTDVQLSIHSIFFLIIIFEKKLFKVWHDYKYLLIFRKTLKNNSGS